MRGLFGVVGLLLVLAIVGLLAKKQMTSLHMVSDPAATAAGVSVPGTTPGATVKEQSQQIQQQYKQQVEAAMQKQPPRGEPDEK